MLSAAEVAPQVAFVGGHPMAGKLTHGSADADAALFDGTVYCLTPTADTPPAAIQRVTELVEAVGARPHFLDAATSPSCSARSEEHTSELQSRENLVCRLL